MDFMSADVNDERAPKGLTCPTITAVPDDGPSTESCPLCDSPRTLGIIHEKQAEEQGVSGNSAATSADKRTEKSVDGTMTDAVDGPADRRDDGPGNNQIQRRVARPQRTPIDDPASRLTGKSNDWPSQIQSQTSATRSADRQTDLAENRGDRQTNDTSVASSGGSLSSMGFTMRSDSPHYMDP